MADVTLALTGIAGTGAVGAAGAAPFTNLSGVSCDNAVGTLGAPGVVVMTLPVPSFMAAQTARIFGALPTPTVTAAGYTGNIGDVSLTLPTLVWTLDVLGRDGALATADLTLPSPQVQVQGETGAVGSVSLQLPAPIFAANAPNAASMALPVPQLQAQGNTGLVGTVALTLAMPVLAVAGQAPFVATAAMTLPLPVVQIVGGAGVAAGVNAQLARFALSMSGATGVLGTVSMVLPVLRLTAAGYGQEIGSVVLQLPAMQLQVTGLVGTAAGAYGGPVTVAMQTETLSLSTYSNYPFNSFAKFNGLFLGAAPTGVFALAGATDNGAQIDALARVGISDFGTSHLKRIDRIYVGYRADGNLVLRVFTDEVTQRDYLLQSSQRAGVHGNHARLGKGLVARYWQFEVRNQNGGDFSMDIIELKPTKLVRRVGGSDA